MAYRLKNQADPNITLIITATAWDGILQLAQEYGWFPFSPVLPGSLIAQLTESAPETLWDVQLEVEPDYSDESFEIFVVLEDALTLADVLETAFLEHEPVRLPASFFVIERSDLDGLIPVGIGVIEEMINFCRKGAFQIESYHHQNGINHEEDLK